MKGLRTTALVALAGGAASSIYFMLRVGHPQFLLTAGFTIWVLAPFAAAAFAETLATASRDRDSLRDVRLRPEEVTSCRCRKPN